MTGELEHHYRRTLRWYPRRWRARHEAELLGILMDQAEAEGRTQMSHHDRHDLARRGLGHRLSPALLGVLILLGILADAQVVSMLSFQQSLDTSLLFAPSWPVPDVNERSVPLVVLSFHARTLYLVCALVFTGAAAGSALLLRRMRHA